MFRVTTNTSSFTLGRHFKREYFNALSRDQVVRDVHAFIATTKPTSSITDFVMKSTLFFVISIDSVKKVRKIQRPYTTCRKLTVVD